MHLGWFDRAVRSESSWEQVAGRERPSWYLDPIVARQKRQVHLELARKWAVRINPGCVLKTDVFEEAWGDDRLLPDLLPEACLRIGLDLAPTTVRQARANCAGASIGFVAGDVRSLPLASNSVDLIFSNSTLDHFGSAGEFRGAVHELARVLRPG